MSADGCILSLRVSIVVFVVYVCVYVCVSIQYLEIRTNYSPVCCPKASENCVSQSWILDIATSWTK